MQEQQGEGSGGGAAGGAAAGQAGAQGASGQQASQQLPLGGAGGAASGGVQAGQRPAEEPDILDNPKVRAAMREREKKAREDAARETEERVKADLQKQADRAKLQAEERAKLEADEAKTAAANATSKLAEMIEERDVMTAMLVAGALPQDEYAAEMIRVAAKKLREADKSLTWDAAVVKLKTERAYLFKQAGSAGQGAAASQGQGTAGQAGAQAGQQGTASGQGQGQPGPLAARAAATLNTGNQSADGQQSGAQPKDAWSMSDNDWKAQQERFGVR